MNRISPARSIKASDLAQVRLAKNGVRLRNADPHSTKMRSAVPGQRKPGSRLNVEKARRSRNSRRRHLRSMLGSKLVRGRKTCTRTCRKLGKCGDLITKHSNLEGGIMANKNLAQGQNRQLKSDYARDKNANPSPEEKREVARRQGSSKKINK
jgi:hypothetical protein